MQIPPPTHHARQSDGGAFVAAVAAVGLLAALLATAPAVEQLGSLVQQHASMHMR